VARFSGKVALITGAASGIGRGCALAFAREGATVIVSDIQDSLGADCVKEIAAAGGKAFYRRHNVAEEQSWIDMIAAIKAEQGRLDILVNNAGIGIGGPITDVSLADWRRQQSINLEGVFLGMKHSLPLMRMGKSGAIINVSSISGMIGSVNFAAYSATKGAVRSLTKSVALQCAALKDGIRVNAICPGVVDTPIFKSVEGVKGDGADADALTKALVPLGRAGQPEDIAGGVLYLASDDASYVTGIELVVDGGLITR
jgi:NAD(P)-dependent dehydrogenase (short-subunit alcohol dehydrogenase family)